MGAGEAFDRASEGGRAAGERVAPRGEEAPLVQVVPADPEHRLHLAVDGAGAIDEIVVDRLMETAAKDGYRMQTLVSEIVTSYPFTHRSVREPLTANAK